MRVFSTHWLLGELVLAAVVACAFAPAANAHWISADASAHRVELTPAVAGLSARLAASGHLMLSSDGSATIDVTGPPGAVSLPRGAGPSGPWTAMVHDPGLRAQMEGGTGRTAVALRVDGRPVRVTILVAERGGAGNLASLVVLALIPAAMVVLGAFGVWRITRPAPIPHPTARGAGT